MRRPKVSAGPLCCLALDGDGGVNGVCLLGRKIDRQAIRRIDTAGAAAFDRRVFAAVSIGWVSMPDEGGTASIDRRQREQNREATNQLFSAQTEYNYKEVNIIKQ